MGYNKLTSQEMDGDFTMTEVQLINLELGCGPVEKRMPGFVGLDKDPSVSPDILCDLEMGIIPLPDNSVKAVYAMYLFEHISNPLQIMSEVHRICIPDAIVQITVPHFASDSQAKDPTHVTSYCEDSWRYLCGDPSVPNYGYNFKFELLQISLILTPDAQQMNAKELEFAKRHYTNIIYNITFVLRTIKNYKLLNKEEKYEKQ